MSESSPHPGSHSPGSWDAGSLPPNVRLGEGTLVTGDLAFKRFHSRLPEAVCIGRHCTMEGVHFDLGQQGRLEIGDYCYFTNAVILCEQEIRVGRYVMIGWNVTLTDTDFHPLAPAARIADAVACSPLGAGRPRPPILKQPVVIGDDVWIGPNATILKGVTIGAGAFVEPGSLVTRDVPPGARICGNPAAVVGEGGRQ